MTSIHRPASASADPTRRSPHPSRRGRRGRRGPIAAAAGVLAIALLLTGCTAADESGSTAYSGSDAGVAEPYPVEGGAAVDEGGAASSGDSAASTTSDSDRQVVQTGWMTVEVADPLGSADDATAIVEQVDGRVDSRTEQASVDGMDPSADLVLRIPAADLTAVLDDLRALGEVRSVSISADDVTGATEDLDARIQALQTSVDRLLALMAQATTTTDLVTIESTLSFRQADLDALTAQRASLAEQVAMATLSLSLVSPGTVDDGGPGTFWDAVVAGWNGLVASAGAVLIAFGVALPWLVVVALVAAAVVGVTRMRRRRATAGATAAAADASPTEPGTSPDPVSSTGPAASTDPTAPAAPADPASPAEPQGHDRS